MLFGAREVDVWLSLFPHSTDSSLGGTPILLGTQGGRGRDLVPLCHSGSKRLLCLRTP